MLAFHLNFDGFSLGWTGVILFFVISGFLITGILLDAKARPNYFRNFYLRRALRILPIYYLTFFAVSIFAWQQRQPMGDFVYYFSYTQNYLLGITDFQPQFPIMLNHTWSLAIEEQFYLLWPLAVYRLGKRQLLAMTLGLFSLGLLSRAAMLFTLNQPALIYASLPTQVDSLAAGAALAVLMRSGLDFGQIARKAIWLLVASGTALLLLVQATGSLAYWHPEVWAEQIHNLPLLTLMALFWGSVVAMAALGSRVLSPLLQLSALRHVGKVSYGVYMYHFPTYVLVDKLLGGMLPHGGDLLGQVAVPATKLAVTYVLALASWRLIESPLLGLKERFA